MRGYASILVTMDGAEMVCMANKWSRVARSVTAQLGCGLLGGTQLTRSVVRRQKSVVQAQRS